MSHPAALMRLLGLGMLIFGGTGGAACGRETRVEEPRPATSPVGRYTGKLYRFEGKVTKPDGTSENRISTTYDVTIELRADHTLTYDWRSLGEGGEKDGRLEGTWRDDAVLGRWLVRAKNEAGPERVVLSVEGDIILQPEAGPPVDVRHRKPMQEGQWAFPQPDPATGKLLDSYLFVRMK